MGRSDPLGTCLPAELPSAIADDRYLLETFLQSTPDHVYFKDLDSRFTRISLALARWMGLSSADEAVGRSDADFFADEHAARARSDEERIMRTREPSIGIEEREVWPDGTVTWVSTTKVPLIGQHGEVIGIFGLSRDITERRLAAEQLAQQSEQLAVLAAELETLSISDELTGLHNRRGLRLLGGDRVDAARHAGTSLCVMFLDLDGLKAINDTLGHGAGDQALVESRAPCAARCAATTLSVGSAATSLRWSSPGRRPPRPSSSRDASTSLPHNPSTCEPPPRSR